IDRREGFKVLSPLELSITLNRSHGRAASPPDDAYRATRGHSRRHQPSASRAQRNRWDRDADRTPLSMVEGGDINRGQVPKDNFSTLGLHHMVADGTVAARRRRGPARIEVCV